MEGLFEFGRDDRDRLRRWHCSELEMARTGATALSGSAGEIKLMVEWTAFELQPTSMEWKGALGNKKLCSESSKFSARARDVIGLGTRGSGIFYTIPSTSTPEQEYSRVLSRCAPRSPEHGAVDLKGLCRPR